MDVARCLTGCDINFTFQYQLSCLYQKIHNFILFLDFLPRLFAILRRQKSTGRAGLPGRAVISGYTEC